MVLGLAENSARTLYTNWATLVYRISSNKPSQGLFFSVLLNLGFITYPVLNEDLGFIRRNMVSVQQAKVLGFVQPRGALEQCSLLTLESPFLETSNGPWKYRHPTSAGCLFNQSSVGQSKFPIFKNFNRFQCYSFFLFSLGLVFLRFLFELAFNGFWKRAVVHIIQQCCKVSNIAQGYMIVAIIQWAYIFERWLYARLLCKC